MILFRVQYSLGTLKLNYIKIVIQMVNYLSKKS